MTQTPLANSFTLAFPKDSANPGGGGVPTTFSISGTGFGTNTANIEFIGGSTGELRTAPLGDAQNFTNWQVTSQWAPDKQVVDDATRGRGWGINYNGYASPLNGDIRYDYGSEIPENTDIVVGTWCYLNSQLKGDGQWKILRIKADGGLSDSGGEIVAFNHFDATGKQLILRRGADAETDSTSAYNAKYPDENGTWTYLEFIVKTGGQGVANGDIKQVRHIEGSVYEQPDLTSKFPTDATVIYNSALRFRYFMFQNYLGNGFNNTYNPLYAGMSDQFIQVGSTKRVFLTDNAVFANSTWREFQNHSSWSDTNISGTLNKASRAPGSYWIHVIEDVDTVLASQAQVI